MSYPFGDPVAIPRTAKMLECYCPRCLSVTKWKHTKKYRICKRCGIKILKTK